MYISAITGNIFSLHLFNAEKIKWPFPIWPVFYFKFVIHPMVLNLAPNDNVCFPGTTVGASGACSTEIADLCVVPNVSHGFGNLQDGNWTHSSSLYLPLFVVFFYKIVLNTNGLCVKLWQFWNMILYNFSYEHIQDISLNYHGIVFSLTYIFSSHVGFCSVFNTVWPIGHLSLHETV